MKKFTCRTEYQGQKTRVSERSAETAEDAAEQCAKALHKAYWQQPCGEGTDIYGDYCEFSVHEGKRAVGSVRVYG